MNPTLPPASADSKSDAFARYLAALEADRPLKLFRVLAESHAFNQKESDHELSR